MPQTSDAVDDPSQTLLLTEHLFRIALSNIQSLFGKPAFDIRGHRVENPNDVHMFMQNIFDIFLDVNKHERIGGHCFDAYIHIAVIPALVSDQRAEDAEFKNSVFIGVCSIIFQ